MSFGAPATVPYPTVSGTAPDGDQYVSCPGCSSLTMQITNQGILITFGRGPAGGEFFDVVPETYLPVVGAIQPTGGFDAFRWRALTPAAKLPAGARQSFAILTPRK